MSQGTRRLAAIMFTDIVGFTAFTQSDESQSLQVLDRHNSLLRPFFPKFRGREVKTIGDSFLVEFDSALDATNCAIDIQSFLRDYNASLGEEWKIVLRIGIHLGDVVHKEGDVFGDAVNIASRIQPLAEPGGVCVSDQIYGQVRNKIHQPLTRLEPRELKGVNFPIDVYKVVMPWEKAVVPEAYACSYCGRPLTKDEFSGLRFCATCDTILSQVPEGRTYMLLGVPGTGKSVFLYKLMDLYLRNSKPCVFVALDELPSALRSSIGNFIGGLERKEEDGVLTFVDCYSCLGGLASQEKYHLDSPGDLNGLASMISKLMVDKGGNIRVFVDSATTMFAHCESDAIVKFLYSMSSRLKNAKGSLFFTLSEGAVSPEIQKGLEQLADGLVEFKLTETAGRVKRYYRFSKVRGILYFDSWLPLFIGNRTIHLTPPEEPETRERFTKILNLIRTE